MKYFYDQDKYYKEPAKIIIKVFILSGLITIPLALILGAFVEQVKVGGIMGIFITSFITAALIEESLKCWMVKKFAFNKPFFDEVIDGIVYAVAASLGFATLENLIYVMFDEQGLMVALLRAFTAVPAHALDGAILGYFLGIAKFSHQSKQNMLIRRGLFMAILFHGLYDFFLFSGLFFMIFPLLLIQGRYVQIAIKQSYYSLPPEKLFFEFSGLTNDLGFFDYIKFILGVFVSIFIFLIAIGTVQDLAYTQELEKDILAGIIIFCVIMCLFVYWCFKGLINKKSV